MAPGELLLLDFSENAGRDCELRRRVQVVTLRIRVKERLHFAPQCLVIRATLVEQRVTFTRRQVRRGVEQFPKARVALGGRCHLSSQRMTAQALAAVFIRGVRVMCR
jgi:hypothetical protein